MRGGRRVCAMATGGNHGRDGDVGGGGGGEVAAAGHRGSTRAVGSLPFPLAVCLVGWVVVVGGGIG